MKDYQIEQCSLHGAAAELLEACRLADAALHSLEESCEYDPIADPCELNAAFLALSRAMAKAEGRS